MNTILDVEGIGMTSARTRLRLVQRLQSAGITDSQVLEVIQTVPRHLFVDEALAHRAYEDTALPIGYGQTISQPYIVARMTAALLAGGPAENVLEIGSGSGYQTAILAQLVKQVVTIERLAPLAKKAQLMFRRLGLRNVRSIHANGYHGCPAYAPFDGIIVTAAPETIPESLLYQLSDGGRLVIPVGESQQALKLITRVGHDFRQLTLDLVKFVPLVDEQ